MTPAKRVVKKKKPEQVTDQQIIDAVREMRRLQKEYEAASLAFNKSRSDLLDLLSKADWPKLDI